MKPPPPQMEEGFMHNNALKLTYLARVSGMDGSDTDGFPGLDGQLTWRCSSCAAATADTEATWREASLYNTQQSAHGLNTAATIQNTLGYLHRRSIGICPELNGRIAAHFNDNSFAHFETIANLSLVWMGLQYLPWFAPESQNRSPVLRACVCVCVSMCTCLSVRVCAHLWYACLLCVCVCVCGTVRVDDQHSFGLRTVFWVAYF